MAGNAQVAHMGDDEFAALEARAFRNSNKLFVRQLGEAFENGDYRAVCAFAKQIYLSCKEREGHE